MPCVGGQSEIAMMRHLRPYFVVGAVGCAFTACKGGDLPVENQTDEVEAVLAQRAPKIEFYADSSAYIQHNNDFFFKVWNENFTRRLIDMPKTGEIKADRKPYSGYWYPEMYGGTNIVVSGNATPLQKYDNAFHGGDDKAEAWETEKHSGKVDWAGHCNGFAAASVRHPIEPFKNVTRNGVTFSPKDIKALMAELYMSADFEFLGGNRCEIEGVAPRPSDRDDPEVMSICEDINPGTLHAAMANWLGKMRHGLIMDKDIDNKVYNLPLYKYEVLAMNDDITRTQAMAAITGSGGTYTFNPRAVSFALLHTRLTYVNYTEFEDLGKFEPRSMNLHYVLELNAAGEIIGGEWTTESQGNHPDFIWVPLPPMEPNGTRFLGNPHIDGKEVIKLWAESTDQDPNSPMLDIDRPLDENNWGRWPDFDVVLDGGTRGAVFAGKPTKLSINRRNALAEAGVALDIHLNGEEVETIVATDNSAMHYAFTAGLGLNRFQFTWRNANAEVETRYLRFVVVP